VNSEQINSDKCVILSDKSIHWLLNFNYRFIPFFYSLRFILSVATCPPGQLVALLNAPEAQATIILSKTKMSDSFPLLW